MFYLFLAEHALQKSKNTRKVDRTVHEAGSKCCDSSWAVQQEGIWAIWCSIRNIEEEAEKARSGGGVEKNLGRPTVLNEEAEKELAQILLDVEARLYGLTPTDVRRIVYKYCVKNDIQNNFNNDAEMAGRYWFEGFLRRNPQMSVRQAESVSIQRAIGFNKPKVDIFCAVLKQTLFNDSGDEVIPPGNIYNVDESGYTVCQKPNKIIAKKGKHNVGQLTSAEKGKTVTAVCCMSATGVLCRQCLSFLVLDSNLH